MITLTKFLGLSFSLCINFVMRIAFAALVGFFIDRYFDCFPLLTIILTILGLYFGFKGLIKSTVGKS